MIIQGKIPLEVGTRVDGVQILVDRVYQPAQPFFVLRAATQEEYLVYVAETGKLRQLWDPSNTGPYFYEISVD